MADKTDLTFYLLNSQIKAQHRYSKAAHRHLIGLMQGVDADELRDATREMKIMDLEMYTLQMRLRELREWEEEMDDDPAVFSAYPLVKKG